jgi:hypothetical protein
MTIPDYRIRFPSAKIDFDEDVHGGSPGGQDVDDFPQPGTQARYDWIRLTIIGLLANQSSVEEPLNYKIGSLWHNLNDGFFKYFDGEDWAELTKAIRIGETNLEEWSELVNETVGKVTEAASFTGVAESNNITEIDIPDSAMAAASYNNNHPVLYKNDLLIDPRLTSFNLDRNKVLFLDNEAGSVKLNRNDRYTILIHRLDTVVPETVVVS